jgi:hypothetical protein
VVAVAANAATITVRKNEQNGLLIWSSESEGLSVEFIQLLPDYVRAVFGRYDFPKAEIERIASYCVFGSIVKNSSQQPLSYRVANWYYTDKAGQKHSVKTKTQWLEEWREAGIRFSWIMLADSHDFDIGDWQQGFTTVELPPDSEFSFTYTWTLDGSGHSATIENMRCSPARLQSESNRRSP